MSPRQTRSFQTKKFLSSLLLVLICSLLDRKSTRLNSSHMSISYAVFCLYNDCLFLHSFPTRRSSDLDLFKFVDTPEDAFRVLRDGLTKYHLTMQPTKAKAPDVAKTNP